MSQLPPHPLNHYICRDRGPLPPQLYIIMTLLQGKHFTMLAPLYLVRMKFGDVE
jgi:hypothetical protein